MSPAQSLCDWSGSTERPATFTPRFSNSGLSAATRPSSVVHTGVKSFGCENSTPQLFPSHWWKLIGPSVVSAVKSGAVSPSCSAIVLSVIICLVAVIADDRTGGKSRKHGLPRGGLGSLVDLRNDGLELLLRNRHARRHAAAELEQCDEVPARVERGRDRQHPRVADDRDRCPLLPGEQEVGLVELTGEPLRVDDGDAPAHREASR